MISPIPPAGRGTSSAAPVHETVLHFVASGEMREFQRRERNVVHRHETADVLELAFVEMGSEDCGNAGASATSEDAQSGQNSPQHALDDADAGAMGARRGGEDAAAPAAGRGHGSLSPRGVSRRDVATRAQRLELSAAESADLSESPAFVPGATGSREEAESGSVQQGSADPSHSTPAPAATANLAPTGHARGTAGDVSAFTPRIGMEVIAAAFGSGGLSADQVGIPNAMAVERNDELDQLESSQEVSSQQRDGHVHHATGQRSLQQELSFGDGEGREHTGEEGYFRQGNHRRGSRREFSEGAHEEVADEGYLRHGGHRRRGDRGSSSGDGGQERPPREEQSTSLLEADGPSETVVTNPRAALTVEPDRVPALTLPDDVQAEGVSNFEDEAQSLAPDASCDETGIDSVAPITLPQTGTMGLLGNDEYFFFHDARFP